MKVLLNMDNGSTITVDDVRDVNDLLSEFKNPAGIMVNGFLRLNQNTYFNPSHISTIQVEE